VPLIGRNLEDVERCPQCGIAKPLLEYKSHFSGKQASGTVVKVWFSYRCSSCGDLVGALGLVHSSKLHNFDPFGSSSTTAIWTIPPCASIDDDIPETPRRYLLQALNSINSPDGAIMLAGSAIDAMLKIKGYSDGSVFSRINQAVSDNVLTKGMSEWAHAVRLESNKPRHADLDDPHATSEMAKQTVAFAQALGEFLFALPARIERGKAASDKAAQHVE
jgi:hypothetical protein